MAAPPLRLVDADPDAVLARLRADYAVLTGVELTRADPETLAIETFAAGVARFLSVVNGAASSDLLAHAAGPHLDALVALNGLVREPLTPATATVRLVRAAPGDPSYLAPDAEGRQPAVVVPAGTRVLAAGTTYETAADAAIGPLDEVVDVAAAFAGAGGLDGDGLGVAADVLDPVDGLGGALVVRAVAGTDAPESDDRLRARALLARALQAVEAPADWYAARAVAAHPGVGQAAVSDSPGRVEVTVAGHYGALPTPAMLASVEAAFDRDARGVGMEVAVLAPGELTVDAEFSYTVTPAGYARRDAVEADVLAAFRAYRAWQEGGLGRDVAASRLYAAVQAVDGVASVEVAAPRPAVVSDDLLVRVRLVAARYAGVSS